jgi:hypothetical protein
MIKYLFNPFTGNFDMVDDAVGVPAGIDTQVQFNDNNAFGGNAGFTYNKTLGRANLTSLSLGTLLDALFVPDVTDGVSAIAYTFDTKNTLANTSAKLASWRNNTSEKLYIDYLGKIINPQSIGCYAINSSIASITNPTYSFNGDANTGWSWTNPDTLSAIAGGAEYLQISSAGVSLLNNNWFNSKDNAGTGVVNMFRVNTANEIESGAPLSISQFDFSENGGVNTFIDMSVTNAAVVNTEESYVFKLDGNDVLKIYSESDGTGGIKNIGIKQQNLFKFANVITLGNDATFAVKTGIGGWGFVMAGDNEERTTFYFTIAGVVTLGADATANTANTDTDTKLCVYNGGSGIVIKNRLGSSKLIRYAIYAN